MRIITDIDAQRLYEGRISEKGIKKIILISGGFRELTDDRKNTLTEEIIEISKAYGIPVLLTSQVRGSFREEGVEVEPVATRVLKFWSEIIIGLRRTAQKGVILARIEKPTLNKESQGFQLILGAFGIQDREHHGFKIENLNGET